MLEKTFAVLIDHDWSTGSSTNGPTLAARTDALRRLLEPSINLKQMGPGLFCFREGDKEAAYEAVDHLEDWIAFNSLRYAFTEISSLEEDFETWKIEHDNMLQEQYDRGGLIRK